MSPCARDRAQSRISCNDVQIDLGEGAPAEGPRDLPSISKATARAAGDWFTLASLETPYLGFLPRWWCGLVQRRPARTGGLRSPREPCIRVSFHHVNDDMVTASR